MTGVITNPRPALTPARALLIVAVDRYLARAREQEVRSGISEREIQKLVYFLTLFGGAFPLSFVRGRYGPHAEKLPEALDLLEGRYLTGFGDHPARVTELFPIIPLASGLAEAESVVAAELEDGKRLQQLLELVDGFETLYMELLATVHFAAAQPPPAADVEVIDERVVAWGLRKARLFTQYHVQVATERLAEQGLLPRSGEASPVGA